MRIFLPSFRTQLHSYSKNSLLKISCQDQFSAEPASTEPAATIPVSPKPDDTESGATKPNAAEPVTELACQWCADTWFWVVDEYKSEPIYVWWYLFPSFEYAV
jgi:hypothetical protein